MLWFFARGESRVRLVTWFDTATQEFVAEIQWPGQPVATQRFHDREAFRSHLVTVEQQLAEERWLAEGTPEILPSLWRGDVVH